MKPEQEIMRAFFSKTNQKTTPAQARKTVGQAKQLLKAGYSSEEIIKCIEYLVQHPPKKGLTSLGFLSYVINDVLAKVKLEEAKSFQEEQIDFSFENSTANITNQEKFKTNRNQKIKGMGRF